MSDLADFSLADAWETIADVVGDAPALYHQDIVRTWAEFEERSARLASVLLAHGIGHDSKVAHYLYNGPEYLEATFASFKARAVPVNVNYRYTDAELSYLLDNSDAEGIVVDTTFADHVERLLPSLPKVKLVVEVGGSVGIEGRGGVAWVGYEEAIAAAEPAPRIARSGDDLWFLYTGGTTGMPKGVMWPHRSLFGTGAATFKNFKLPLPATLDELADSVRTIHAEHEAIRLLPAAPLMHGTSAIASWGVMCVGGAINTLAQHADVVVLTNLHDKHNESRRRQLAEHGIDCRVFTNQGPKGPALQAILDEYQPSKAVFIDDLAQHHGSAAELVPHIDRLHLCGEPTLAPHITCGFEAGHAHARIDTWDHALPWLLARIGAPAQ